MKSAKAKIEIQRVYHPDLSGDEPRFLVDRLWPRGVKKEALRLTGWLKDVAPSDKLRKWFKHDAVKWREFQKRYRAELEARPESWRPLLEAAMHGNLILLFSAHDLEHNNAMALKMFLEEKLSKR